MKIYTPYDKILLIFILVLGIIAISIWTIFLIQLSQLIDQSIINQEIHINHSLETKQEVDDAKQNAIEAKNDVKVAKEIAKQTLDIAKINKKNIETILGNNITEMK